MNSKLPTDDELRSRLSEEQYRVTQQQGTERAFTGAYVDNKATGTYRCVCCDAELFSSANKYDSGSGWPSFWLPLAGDAVKTRLDSSHGMLRRASRALVRGRPPAHGAALLYQLGIARLYGRLYTGLQ